jgi:hypothetical protein
VRLRCIGMGTVISILLANYTLTSLALGLMTAGISLWGRPRRLTACTVVEDVFAYLLAGRGVLHRFPDRLPQGGQRRDAPMQGQRLVNFQLEPFDVVVQVHLRRMGLRWRRQWLPKIFTER